MILLELQTRPDEADKLLSLMRSVRALAVQHPGYEGGTFWRSTEDPNKLVVVTHWRTLDGWETFKKTPAMTEVLSSLSPLLSQRLVERQLTSAENDTFTFLQGRPKRW